jgi:hypothetical protein
MLKVITYLEQDIVKKANARRKQRHLCTPSRGPLLAARRQVM